MEGLLPDGDEVKDPNDLNNGLPFKVIFVGDSGIGKTSVINRYVNEYFNQYNQMTMQCSFQSKVVQIPRSKKEVRLHVWDTAGDEKFRNIVKMYYRGAQVVVLCYDITMQDSFDNLKPWIDEIDQNLNRDECIVVICGWKWDLEDVREVETRDAMKLAKENGYKLFETSAKENTGIDYMFTEIARMLYENPPKAKRKDTVKVTHTDHDENEKSFFSKISSWC